MPTAFVFGAGASADYGGIVGSLPIDSDFLAVADEMWNTWPEISTSPPQDYDGTRWQWPKLRSEILRRLGARRINEVGLERAFSALANDSYWRDRFTRCIELVLFWRLRRLGSSELSHHVRLLRTRCQPGDTILTFNYDPLIEASLDVVAKTSNILWSRSGGMGLRFNGRMIQGRGIEPLPEEPTNVTLLKLHGSLNWVVPADRRSPHTPSLLRLDVDDNSGPGFSLVRDRHGGTYRSVFVPPQPGKAPQILGLEPLWKMARVALASAERWIVIGYRLPDTDREARDLLVEAYSRTPRPNVTIVTPDSVAAESFRRVLAGVGVEPFTFSKYVEKLIQ